MLLLLEVLLGSVILANTYFAYHGFIGSKEYAAKLERGAAMDRQIADAVNSYIAENYEILTSQISSGRICDAIHRATDPWPAWKGQIKHIGTPYIDDGYAGETPPCGARPPVYNDDFGLVPGSGLCSDNECVSVTLADLKTANSLPNGTAERDEFGSDYAIVIRRSGTAPYYNLDALVATKDPVYRNTTVYQDLMGLIVPQIGDAYERASYSSRSTGVVRAITAQDIALRADLAGAGVGALSVFGIASKGIESDGTPVNKLGWSATNNDGTITRRWPNITTEGQVVTIVGYKASQWSSYLRRDGTLPMTGDLNMDQNNIRNAGFVQTILEAPFDSVCNNSAGTTPAEKAPVGAMARVATGSNAIGEGMMLVCQMDVMKGIPTQSIYRWKKLTSGVDVEDDLIAGLNSGYETTEMPACLSDGVGNWIGGGSAPWPAPQSQKWTKWVYGKSSVGLYVNTFVDPMSGAPGPGQWMRTWARNYVASGTVNQYLSPSFYSVASEVNRNAFCTSSLQDPGRVVATGAGQAWVGIQDTDRSVLMITPKLVQYFAKGVFGRTAADPSINANMGKVVSFVGHVDVPSTTCTTDAFGATTCTSTTNSYPVTHDPNDSNVITKENWIASQIGQTINWVPTRRSLCVDGAGALKANC